MANLTKYRLFLLAASLALVTCTKDPAGSEDPETPQSPYLAEISVSRQPLAVAGADEPDDADGPEVTPAEPADPNSPFVKVIIKEKDEEIEEEIVGTRFIPGQSIIHVSQRTRYYDPFATDQKEGAPAPPPHYRYLYYDNPDADWDAGFNFRPFGEVDKAPGDSGAGSTPEANPNALDWDTVKSNGSVGNGFALFAMYYPVDYDDMRYQVKRDQSALEDLQRSDILGAYHSTSALYSRVRFRMWHLMTYIKVNLYVPVYKETRKNEKEDLKTSGYTPESMLKALVLGACPEFTVEWGQGVSSDKSPRIGVPSDYESKIEPDGIAMYSHWHASDWTVEESPSGAGQAAPGRLVTRGDEPDPGTSTAPTIPTSDIRPRKTAAPLEIDIAKFLPADMLSIQPLPPAATEGNRITSMKDEVYHFSFSVIIPVQYSAFIEQKNPGWLRFQFASPGAGTIKNYAFNGGFGSESSTSTIDLTQGRLQVLNLYLPRQGDQVISVGASIKPWAKVDSDMNLPQQKPDGEDQN